MNNKPNFTNKSDDQRLVAAGWQWTGHKWISPNKKDHTREEALVILAKEQENDNVRSV